MKTFDRKKIYLLLSLLAILAGAFLFFRDPIYFGERNADKLAERDAKGSADVMATMPEDLAAAMERLNEDSYHDNLIFMKDERAYYAMASTNGDFLVIDTEDFSAASMFCTNYRTFGMKAKDGIVEFMTGVTEARDKRSFGARVIHPSKVRVLTKIKHWRYDIYKGTLEEL